MEQKLEINDEKIDEAELSEAEYYERDSSETLKNPKYVGINFDTSMILDARYTLTDQEAEVIYSASPAQIEKFRRDEEVKLETFMSYIDSFRGNLNHVRVHAYGPISPMSPKWVNREGGPSISLDLLMQLRYLKDNCPDVTVVVPFYDDIDENNKPANVPKSELAASRYIGACECLVDKIGYDIIIEIGNETNVCSKTGENFEIDSFGDHVDPIEYADFFIKTARVLKNEHPNLKLSLAGTACFDNSYIETVLAEISKYEQVDGQKLVDVISYHPYGKDSNSAYSISQGQFITGNLDFQQQYESLHQIADKYGVSLTIGEINYPKGCHQEEELAKFLDNAAKIGTVSCIWPSYSMHEG